MDSATDYRAATREVTTGRGNGQSLLQGFGDQLRHLHKTAVEVMGIPKKRGTQ
jgi:hypothetical protein